MGLLALVAVCTDLGPLVGTVDGTGALEGSVAGRLAVEGTVEALTIRAWGQTLYRGSLADLHPIDVSVDPFVGREGGEAWAVDLDLDRFGGSVEGAATLADLHRAYGTGVASLARVVEDHARQVGVLTLCSAGGTDAVRVGAWPEPLPLAPGRRAVWSTHEEVRVRGPDGAASVYVALPMDRALAASVAAELIAARPGARTGVAWRDGVALLAWSDDAEQAIPSDVEPAAGEAPILGLLDLDVGALPERPTTPALDPGAEALALLNDLRDTAGLERLAWDEGLGLAALQHAAYVLHQDRFPAGHRQDPASPLFLGERPADRGGATEVIVSSHPPLSPRQALERWLSAPYHRVPLLHPDARRIGIAGIGGVWVAEVDIADAGSTGAWPARGETVPGVSFVGRESPDPLPLVRYPDRVWPVGYPITLWTPQRVRTSELLHGDDPVAHWVVRSPLGEPDLARHLVPKEPLEPGEAYTWTARTEDLEGVSTQWSGRFQAPDDPLDALVPLPDALVDVVARANAQRAQPLRATARAAALARLMSARTRAMGEGLDPTALRDVLGPIRGQGEAPVKLCVRPGEAFDLDEALLDPRYHEVGVDPRATTVTWRSDPAPRVSLQSPRTCAFLYP